MKKTVARCSHVVRPRFPPSLALGRLTFRVGRKRLAAFRHSKGRLFREVFRLQLGQLLDLLTVRGGTIIVTLVRGFVFRLLLVLALTLRLRFMSIRGRGYRGRSLLRRRTRTTNMSLRLVSRVTPRREAMVPFLSITPGRELILLLFPFIIRLACPIPRRRRLSRCILLRVLRLLFHRKMFQSLVFPLFVFSTRLVDGTFVLRCRWRRILRRRTRRFISGILRGRTRLCLHCRRRRLRSIRLVLVSIRSIFRHRLQCRLLIIILVPRRVLLRHRIRRRGRRGGGVIGVVLRGAVVVPWWFSRRLVAQWLFRRHLLFPSRDVFLLLETLLLFPLLTPSRLIGLAVHLTVLFLLLVLVILLTLTVVRWRRRRLFLTPHKCIPSHADAQVMVARR